MDLSYMSSGETDSDDNDDQKVIRWKLPRDKLSEQNPYKKITRRIDAPKIRNHQKKDVDVSISSVNEVLMNKENLRAGVIIYTKYCDKTYFCLGVDTESGNLTDFGGGVKKDENIIQGGLRELAEESLGVFENPNIDDAIVFHSNRVAIMFVQMNVDPQKITNDFKQRIEEHQQPEVCDIVWLTTDELLESIHGRGKTLYIVVRKILSKVTSTIRDL